MNENCARLLHTPRSLPQASQAASLQQRARQTGQSRRGCLRQAASPEAFASRSRRRTRRCAQSGCSQPLHSLEGRVKSGASGAVALFGTCCAVSRHYDKSSVDPERNNCVSVRVKASCARRRCHLSERCRYRRQGAQYNVLRVVTRRRLARGTTKTLRATECGDRAAQTARTDGRGGDAGGRFPPRGVLLPRLRRACADAPAVAVGPAAWRRCARSPWRASRCCSRGAPSQQRHHRPTRHPPRPRRRPPPPAARPAERRSPRRCASWAGRRRVSRRARRLSRLRPAVLPCVSPPSHSSDPFRAPLSRFR